VAIHIPFDRVVSKPTFGDGATSGVALEASWTVRAVGSTTGGESPIRTRKLQGEVHLGAEESWQTDGTRVLTPICICPRRTRENKGLGGAGTVIAVRAPCAISLSPHTKVASKTRDGRMGRVNTTEASGTFSAIGGTCVAVCASWTAYQQGGPRAEVASWTDLTCLRAWQRVGTKRTVTRGPFINAVPTSFTFYARDGTVRGVVAKRTCDGRGVGLRTIAPTWTEGAARGSSKTVASGATSHGAISGIQTFKAHGAG
jgi:hypothetical protein